MIQTSIVTMMAAAIVLLIPGLAAVTWASRHTAPSVGASTGVERIGLAYAGVGIAVLALWLLASVLGVSRWTSLGAPIAGAAILWLAAIRGRAATGEIPAAPDRSRHDRRAARVLLLTSVAAVCLVAIPFATFGWERADGVHRMAMTDWEKHIVMANAIASSPAFPPPHPYIHSDPTPSYYFGYQLVAAAMTKLGGGPADVFASLFLLTLLTAAATPFVVYTFARDVCDSRTALVAAVAATVLVGFDAVVLAVDTVRALLAAWPLASGLAGLRALIPSTHIDYWVHNVERSFSTPIIALMWAPHQVAATLIALLLLYLRAPRPDDPGRPRAGWLLPALLLASLPALSSYIAMALAVGIGGAVLLESAVARRAPWTTGVFRRWLVPGVVGFVLALPVYPTLVQGSSSGLTLHISSAGTWSNGAIATWLFGERQWTSLLDTPALYLVELGVIGLLGVLQLRHLRRVGGATPVQRDAAAVAVAVLLLVTVVRPPIGIGNNLYARAVLLVWFVLAPFAAMAVSRLGRPRWIAAGALVCALGTAYAEIGYLLEGSLFWATPKSSVDALRWVNVHTPPGSVVAIRPADYENPYGYWLRRPLVLGGRRLALLFGAEPGHYDQVSASLESAFAARDADVARRRFDALGADVILVRREHGDPGWTRAPCFAVTDLNADWTVAVRDRAACAP